MLSLEDIYQEIGKNIFISPLKIDNFRDNSIDLTASEFAWTYEGTNLCDKEKMIITVPKHKTACILTNESIYVSGKIGGTYHSRVSLTERGFGHVGTMLDPKYCGQSLIMLHNTTENDLEIKVGDRIVSLVFYYLKTPIREAIRSSPPSHVDKVGRLDSEGNYRAWKENNKWVDNPQLLQKHYKESDAKAFEEKRNSRAQTGKVKRTLTAIRKYALKYFIILILFAISLLAIHKFFTPTTGWSSVIVPMVTCFVGFIAGDLSKVITK